MAFEALSEMRRCVRALEELPDVMELLGVGELAEVMALLLRLHGRSDQVATLIARPASQRGDVRESDAANTTQWIGDCAANASIPLDIRDAHTIAAVADACRDGSHQSVTDALRAGTCTPSVARSALTEVAKIEPIIRAGHDHQCASGRRDGRPDTGQASGRRPDHAGQPRRARP